MPDGVHRLVQLHEDGRGAKYQGRQTEHSRKHACPGLVGALDEVLNGTRHFRPGHVLDFRREPALGSLLPINHGGQSDGYDNHGSQRQQGIECHGSAEARNVIVDPFARCLPEHSRQRLERKP